MLLMLKQLAKEENLKLNFLININFIIFLNYTFIVNLCLKKEVTKDFLQLLQH
jgi:hypothetical protein